MKYTITLLFKMIRFRLRYFVALALLLILCSFIKHSLYERNEKQGEVITIALVVCESRLEESLVMIKSGIIFQFSAPLRFVIIADYNLQSEFDNVLKTWKAIVKNSFTYELHNLSFPKDRTNEWRNLFQPCASQRLFLPDVLTHLDSVLYVDTDCIFLSPLIDIWKHFKYMNESQIAALTPEHEDPNTGWYNRFARHPYYGKLGVNSGVMLMNLTRMRIFKWVSYLYPVYKEYKLKLTWGDQDIINIIFHYHTDKLYIYPCHYNYRPDHCMYMSVCKSSEKHGVAILHGSRGAFHSSKQLAFKTVYDMVNKYELGTEPYKYLQMPMLEHLKQTRNTSCGSASHLFTKNMEKYFMKSNKSSALIS